MGVLTDDATMERKPRPILPFEERLLIVSAIQYVDFAIPQNYYRCYENILKIKPDILVINENWAEEEMEKLEACREKIGAKIVVVPRYPMQSSSNIKDRIRDSGSYSIFQE